MASDEMHLSKVIAELRAVSSDKVTVKILGVQNLAMVKTLISSISLSLKDENGYEIASSESP
jgi:hypothetical protein